MLDSSCQHVHEGIMATAIGMRVSGWFFFFFLRLQLLEMKCFMKYFTFASHIDF
jgi:hypothetical protein